MLHVANAILAFTAVLQTGLITLNSLQREVPLPNNFIKWTLETVMGDSVAAEWSGAAFDLRGGLYLENFALHRTSTEDTILDAALLRIDFSMFDLLLGFDWPVQEINAAGVGIFIPASASPSGLNEPVMQVSQARLLQHEELLVVDYLNVDCNGLRFHISGSGPLHALLDAARDSDAPPQQSLLPELLARIHRLPPALDIDCRVHWASADGRQHVFDLFFLSEELTLPMAKLTGVSAAARIQGGPSGFSLTDLSGNAVLAFLNPNSFPQSLERWPLQLPIDLFFSASGAPVPASPFAWPGNLRINLIDPFSQNFPVDVITADTSFARPLPEIHWTLRGPEVFASGLTHIIPTPADAPAGAAPNWQIDFRAEFANPVLHSFFPDLPFNRHLVNAHASRLRLHASLSTQSNSASGLLLADDLFLGQTRFAHLRSNFSLSRSDLALTHIHVRKSSREFAAGSYFQHFPSSRFSLNATGHAFPEALDAILGAWWPRIFRHISINDPVPADVTVWGYWGGDRSIRSMTSVLGKEVSYRGMAIPELGVRVRSNADWAWLEALKGEFADGVVEGQLGWVISGESGTGLHPMLLDLRSDAGWEVVQAASGLAALERMEFAGNPELRVRGIIWHDLDGQEAGVDRFIPDLELELDQRRARAEIEGWEFDGISFSGRLTETELMVDRMSGTFADGVLTGTLTIRDWEFPERREKWLALQLFDADYGEVLSQVTRNQEDSELIRGVLAAEPASGRVDTSMNLVLRPGPGLSTGSGDLSLRNAPIGEFHLFGGLSRFLSSIGLGFSTLNLDSGFINWQLEAGTLEISRCALTGPVLNLDMSGDIDLLERQLDLRADATFFSGLVSKVLTPVSDNLQFDISGPLESPIWKLRLNPLRWFQNRLQL